LLCSCQYTLDRRLRPSFVIFVTDVQDPPQIPVAARAPLTSNYTNLYGLSEFGA